MGFRNLSRETYAGVRAKVEKAGGDTSFAGRQHIRETKKLHPLVDPAGYGLIRKSLPRYVDLPDGRLHLVAGVPMLVETSFDTTGSMARNIKFAFDSLPKLYSLLTEGKHPVLGRYDPQVLNAIFGDVCDQFVLARTQAEMDEKIPEQLTLMVPEGGGGDSPEDPEYGLFGAAYLTDAAINDYGLKYYHFTVTDTTSHGRIDEENLVRVFGKTVFDVVKANGHDINSQDLPMTKEIVSALKKRAHAFMILVRDAASYWGQIYGDDCIVVIDSTEYLPYIEASIIGLTEGVLDLQSLPKYLKDVGCDTSVAREIQRAVAGIPIGAQMRFKNFKKIPKKGTVFAQKRDLWPVLESLPPAGKTEGEAGSVWL